MINHKQILSKLKSYKSLHELTKAIQLVAMSKLRSLKKKEPNRGLLSSYRLISPVKQHNKECILIMPVTTDKSCCGSINNNIMDIVKYYNQSLKDSFKIFLIGKKGVSISKKFYRNEFIYNLVELTKYNLSIITVMILIEKIKEKTQENNFTNYIIIYNYFKNIVTQKVASLTVQSENIFLLDLSDKLNNYSFINNVIEGKHNSFLRDLYDYSLYSVLIKVLYENEMSEYGARASSMRNASKNAEDLIAKLQLQYNKARQAHITNELIEIISCVNSIMSSDNLDKYSFYLKFIHE